MRLKVQLTVAVLGVAVPSLAMAASTAPRKGADVRVTGAYSVRNTQHFQECGYQVGPQKGWVFSPIRGRGWLLAVRAVNNSATNPSADNVHLASSNHFEVEFFDLNKNKTWGAGRMIFPLATVKRTGSGTLSVSKVRMKGLPGGAKYGLVGSINAYLNGVTTYYEDVNFHKHPLVTKGKLHVTSSFACWFPFTGQAPPGK